MKPQQSVVPILVYQDIQAAHDFLVKVFGFKSCGVTHGPDGKVMHGEVQAGDTRIWLHRVTTDHRLDTPRKLKNSSTGLIVFVPDVDAHYARVHAAGVTVDSAPKDMAYGQREYGVRDTENHRWWFATPLASTG